MLTPLHARRTGRLLDSPDEVGISVKPPMVPYLRTPRCTLPRRSWLRLDRILGVVHCGGGMLDNKHE